MAAMHPWVLLDDDDVGSQLRSSYISFVSSQDVSDPINSRVFFVVLCLSVRQTQPHAYLSDANVDAPESV